MENNAISWRI